MLCKNCGSNIPEGSKFCPYCSAQVVDSPEQQLGQPAPETNGKKKVPMIAGIVAVVVIIIGVIIAIFAGSSSKGYETEVENFFTYLAEQEDDAEGFITDAYWAGACFGNAFGGNFAKDANIAYVTCMFEIEDAAGSSYGTSSIDNWEDYLEESMLDYLYMQFDNVYGDDWELNYEIANSDKLSGSDIEDLQDEWEEIIKKYEEYVDLFENIDDNFATIEEEDIETIEAFIDEMSDKKIKKAYEVEVDVTIEGDDASLEESYEFQIVQIDDQWVILEGPTIYDFIQDAD
ncbi:MAG: zinc ribbon domain-containing protein [Agathobacter sp.]|nr:zinc ribbon domain-containing protein [Agathobacter sp.]